MEHNTPTPEQVFVLFAPALSRLKNAIPGANYHSLTVTMNNEGKVFFTTTIRVGEEFLSSHVFEDMNEAIRYLTTKCAAELRERAAKLLVRADALEGGAL
jgi:hypothetical protein